MRVLAAPQLCLLNLLGAHSLWRHFDPPRREGEVCGSLRGVRWTCQLESQCKVLPSILKEGRKITCSTEGEENVICCPQSKLWRARPTRRISERKCQEYYKGICNNSNRFSVLTRTGQDLSTEYVEYKVPNSTLSRPNRQLKENMYEDNSLTPVLTMSRGGEKARPREFPYAAMIGYGNSDRIWWACSGSLISEHFVLCAAHCSESEESGPARWVRLGDLDYSTDTDDAQPQQFTIVERIVHSEYIEPAIYNDIALFRLDRPAVFNEYVSPVCLHLAPAVHGDLVTAAGWGKTERHSGESPALMKVEIDLIPNSKCKEKLDAVEPNALPSGVNGKSMICAWNDVRDTCEGDSGGPVVISIPGDRCYTRLVGVTSFGPEHCQPSIYPAIYVRVSSFVPWIESIVWPQSKNVHGLP